MVGVLVPGTKLMRSTVPIATYRLQLMAINPELGGEAGFERLSAAPRKTALVSFSILYPITSA